MRISDWSSDVCSSDLAAFLALQSIGEARILDAENHAMFGVDPFGEGHDHVHQHLVAIGDDERAVHAVVPSSLWAAAMLAGGTCNASAQATRSFSWPVRKDRIAASVARSPSEARSSSGDRKGTRLNSRP